MAPAPRRVASERIFCPAAPQLPDPTQEVFDHVEVAISPSDPDTMYVTFGHCADKLTLRCQPSIYKSTNGGIDWERANPNPNATGPAGQQKLLEKAGHHGPPPDNR